MEAFWMSLTPQFIVSKDQTYFTWIYEGVANFDSIKILLVTFYKISNKWNSEIRCISCAYMRFVNVIEHNISAEIL